MRGGYVSVNLCVNNPDNGMPSGRVCGVHFQGDDGHMELELETGFWSERDNPTCHVDFAKNRLRVGRYTYQIYGYQSWYGNWCWDAVVMKRDDARLLVLRLLDRGFTKDTWTADCDLLPTEVEAKP